MPNGERKDSRPKTRIFHLNHLVVGLKGACLTKFVPLRYFGRKLASGRSARHPAPRGCQTSPAGGSPIATPCRGDDRDRLAFAKSRLRAPRKYFNLPVEAANKVFARFTCFSAGKPERPHGTMAGQDRTVHRSPKADRAAGAVAAIPASPASGARAYVEILKHDGKAQFEDFRIG